MANGQITSAVESAVITALKIAKPEFAPAIEILASLFAAYEAAKGVGAFTEDQVAQHQALAASHGGFTKTLWRDSHSVRR